MLWEKILDYFFFDDYFSWKRHETNAISFPLFFTKSVSHNNRKSFRNPEVPEPNRKLFWRTEKQKIFAASAGTTFRSKDLTEDHRKILLTFWDFFLQNMQFLNFEKGMSQK